MRPNRFIQKVMADALRADETLRAAGVTVIEQDSQELAFLLKKPLAQIDAPVAVVTCDKARKRYTQPVEWDLECSVMVTENVPLNRERPDFLTALDVAFVASETLADVPGVHQTDAPVTHTTPARGILEAEAKFACRVRYDENEQGD
jgi:pseudouridine-5'-phosphate glycosidase